MSDKTIRVRVVGRWLKSGSQFKVQDLAYIPDDTIIQCIVCVCVNVVFVGEH